MGSMMYQRGMPGSMGPNGMGPGMVPGGMGQVSGGMGPGGMGAGGRPGPYPSPAAYMAQKRAAAAAAAAAASQQFSGSPGPGGSLGPQMNPNMGPQVRLCLSHFVKKNS